MAWHCVEVEWLHKSRFYVVNETLVRMTTLLALDIPYIYYRSYFGIPDRFRARDNTPVNAARGVLDTLASVITRYHPTHVAAAWDQQWRPVWRTKLIGSYKAHRVASTPPGTNGQENTPEGLKRQIPLIATILESLGIAPLAVNDHEADDVLGSLVTHFAGHSYIVTGDRDLFQLSDDTTTIIWIAKGAAQPEEVTPQWVADTIGVPAHRYVDYAVLRGDRSDGLPGVKGIGEKTAAKLINQFASLQELLDAARCESPDIPPGIRNKLLAAANYLAPAHKVVSVKRNLLVPPPTPIPRLLEIKKLLELKDTWNLGGSIDRVIDAVSATSVE